MHNPTQPRKQIAARVTLETDRRLRIQAAEQGITKSQLLANLIEQHYPEHTQQKTET